MFAQISNPEGNEIIDDYNKQMVEMERQFKLPKLYLGLKEEDYKYEPDLDDHYDDTDQVVVEFLERTKGMTGEWMVHAFGIDQFRFICEKVEPLGYKIREVPDHISWHSGLPYWQQAVVSKI